MSEFTEKGFDFVCNGYLYYRMGNEVIEEKGSIYRRNPKEDLATGRYVRGCTVFLDKSGNTLRCADESFVMSDGKFWSPKHSIKTAKNVFRLRDDLDFAKKRQYVQNVFESMIVEMGLSGISYTGQDIQFAFDLCNGDYSAQVVRNACGEALGYIGTIER